MCAMRHYMVALGCAQELANVEAIAKSANNLAIVSHIHGDVPAAQDHLARAYETYQQIGKVAAMGGCCITRAVIHYQEGLYNDALAPLTEADTLLQETARLHSGRMHLSIRPLSPRKRWFTARCISRLRRNMYCAESICCCGTVCAVVKFSRTEWGPLFGGVRVAGTGAALSRPGACGRDHGGARKR